MKKILPILAIALAVGCHAQVPPNSTAYACPTPTAPTYTPLNQSSPANGTYTINKPTAGQLCAVAQSVIPSTGQVSNPSNVVGPFAMTGSNSLLLTFTAPPSGPTPTGYVVSTATAVASTLLAPTISNTQLAEVTHDTGTMELAENGGVNAPVLIAVLR